MITAISKEYDWLLMEYYAHWCPHCQHFEPTYKEVAAHMAARGNTAPRIAVARIDCPDHQNLCNEFGITGYPTMYFGKPDIYSSHSSAKLTRLEPASRDTKGVIAEVARQVGVSLEVQEAGTKTAEEKPTEPFKPGVKNSANLRVVQPLPGADLNDIEGAVIESWQYLTEAAMLHGQEARQALEDWLDLLVEAHPIERCRSGAELAAEVLVSAWPPGTEDATFPKALHDTNICGESDFTAYRSCKGSLPTTRGYTCGLWQLFHALSAGMPESDAKSGARWMTAVKGFIKHFFQCTECAKHFTKYAESESALQVVSKKDAVLWMWDAHNKVNGRLGKEEAAGKGGDPQFPKVMWPTTEMCASCQAGKNEEGRITWNEESMYAFLLKHYYAGAAQGKIKLPESATGSGIVVPKHSSGSMTNSWGFAIVICSGIAGTAYSVLRHSGQYAFRKSMNRKL